MELLLVTSTQGRTEISVLIGNKRSRGRHAHCVEDVFYFGIWTPAPDDPDMGYFFGEGEHALKCTIYYFRTPYQKYSLPGLMDMRGEIKDGEWTHPEWPNWVQKRLFLATETLL